MATTVLDELITIIGFKGDTRELDRVQQRVKQIERNINTVARNFGVAGTALTGVGFAVGRTILSFDRAMNTLRATFLDTPIEKIKELEEQARDLGRTTSKSATDAANAQVELARAGLDANQVIGAIPHVLNLAIAGELEMAEAAGLVTNQLAAFGLETTETQRVVDVLAKTATSARTTVSELGPAFRQVAPLAHSLGVSIEETAAVIGTLRSGGLAPEQAGTAFRNILAILQEDPTDRVREGFRNLGLEFETVRDMVSQGDLVGAIKLISDSGLDAKNALAIFGREAASGASSLALAAEEVDGFVERLNNAEGTTERMAEVIGDGLPGSVEEFQSSLQDLQLELGDSGLRGLMIRALETVRDFLRWVSNARGPIKTLTVAAIAAGSALLGLAAGLKAVSFALGGLVPLLRLARGAVWLWRNALLATRIQLGLLTLQTWRANAAQMAMRATMLLGAAATGIATVATAGFGVALNLALGPVGLIILAVAGLIAGVVLLVKNFDWVKEKAQVVWDFILGAVQSVWNWVAQNWPLFLATITGPVGLAVLAFVKFKDDIIGVFASVRDFIVGVWQDIWDSVMGIVNRIKDAPAELLEALPGGKLLQKAGVALPGFAQGGVVPGPQGSPQLALVHGGEMVLPAGLAQMLDGLVAGPAALP